MVSFEFTIKDELGVHARPAGVMVKEIRSLPCSVTIECGTRSADGKKLFDIMGMGIKCAETVRVVIDGEDEDAVKERLETFFAENF
jgi:Phosphotransferase System HPr (HPr) Family